MIEKDDRKNTLATLITTERLSTQQDLVNALKRLGYSTTQATLSRDLKDLGAAKVCGPDGVKHYTIPFHSAIKYNLRILGFEISGQVCVIRCHNDYATIIASYIDKSNIDGVMGTIAGDDTVLILIREDCNKALLRVALNSMFVINEEIQ